jgi:glutamate/tyrosine decarboxylase-like PLP-dependent enzyme
MDMAGLGTDALRRIPCDAAQRIDLDALRAALIADRAAGLRPILIVGTAGGVDTGAIDDLDALAGVCAEEQIWFHVDGAFGALACLSPRLRPLLAGIERADSVAFDFHKWGQVPYDAGCVRVRDPAHQLAAFANPAAYLRREVRGLAGGHPWPCDLGPDLSRGFRALKVWMTLKTYGGDAIGRVAEACCGHAAYLASRIEREPRLELLAPVPLNIVCFRVREGAEDLDRLNADIVADLHEAGVAAPSTTILNGTLAIRAAIVNHRTAAQDLDALVDAVLAAAAARSVSLPGSARMPAADAAGRRRS